MANTDGTIAQSQAGQGPVPVLEMRSISKTFGNVKALTNVSFAAYPGEVHALMGENGAGKSTLMRVLSGAHQADAGGEIRIDGKPVTIGGPLAGRRLGIAIIYQELALAPNLTVAENIFLGTEKSRLGQIDRAAMRAAARPLLERLSATFGPGDLVAGLSIAERQLVEIARALAEHPRILIMDEPTTSLSSRETDRLFAIIRQLRGEGIAIIYISHRMAEVYELADRVSVLRDGSSVGTIDRSELDAPTLVRMMVGRDLSSFYKKEHHAAKAESKPALEVADMRDGDRVHGCSFSLRAGEVVGLAGLVGSGRTELARLIYGADRRTGGSVRLDGKEIDIRNPQQAIDAGIVYLTEDRKHLGLFLDMSIRDNATLGVIARDAYVGGVLNIAAMRRRAAAAIRTLAIRTPHDKLVTRALSGGNQQKVLLARLLETGPRVLILDEPTRGVDVGAKSEIYRLINDAAVAGAAVLVISSELPEILGISDRVLVMRDGIIAGELTAAEGKPVSQDEVMAIATNAATIQAA